MKMPTRTRTIRQSTVLLLLVCTALIVNVNAANPRKPSNSKRGMGRYRGLRMRRLQTGTVRKGKGKGSSSYTDETSDTNEDYWSGENPEEAFEKGKDGETETDEADDNEQPGKGKGKDDIDEEEDENEDESIVSGAEEATLAPTQITSEATMQQTTMPVTTSPTDSPTDSPTISISTAAPTPEPTDEAVVTAAPTLIVTDPPTETVTESPTESIVENALGGGSEGEAPTVAPVESTPSVTSPPAQTNTTSGNNSTETGAGQDGGIFDGDDYYHLHLVPFAVSVEGDAVTNDLGITSCLLTAMQKNITTLFNIDMKNFTIVQFNDEDGDGYDRYDLYFTGFGELLGLPVYYQEYFEEVQLNIIGDGAEFFQACLDSRFADSGQSYTASPLKHDQTNKPDRLETDSAISDREGEIEGEGVLRTRLIIALTVAAVVVALLGILFASRALRGRDDEESAPSRRGK